MMPSMVNDWKELIRQRENLKTLFDNYLKTRPASNREANGDRYVTTIRFIIELLNQKIKMFRFLAQQVKENVEMHESQYIDQLFLNILKDTAFQQWLCLCYGPLSNRYYQLPFSS